jgi:23S rRNA (cytidine1920-2'-O)/16S rRNA (cytidine1409-2'-O)-methyltransferase
MKRRLDAELTSRGLVASRSQAESWIKLGKVTVDGRLITKSGHFVNEHSDIKLTAEERYVSRAGLKLASVAKLLGIIFKDKIVLDVGSSTGGFTDYSLQNGARKVYAVDVGTDQLHRSLHGNPKIELHEKTDIREVAVSGRQIRDTADHVAKPTAVLDDTPDIIVIDVSFISLREILPHIAEYIANKETQIIAMVKPQFEAGKNQANKGVIKNDAIRRGILKDFEDWSKGLFVIVDKRDSDVAGAKGNQERFYHLKLSAKR